MASRAERVDWQAHDRAQWERRQAGQAALRALTYDLGPDSLVEDVVYALASEVLALRERVAVLERKEGR